MIVIVVITVVVVIVVVKEGIGRLSKRLSAGEGWFMERRGNETWINGWMYGQPVG